MISRKTANKAIKGNEATVDRHKEANQHQVQVGAAACLGSSVSRFGAQWKEVYKSITKEKSTKISKTY